MTIGSCSHGWHQKYWRAGSLQWLVGIYVISIMDAYVGCTMYWYIVIVTVVFIGDGTKGACALLSLHRNVFLLYTNMP